MHTLSQHDTFAKPGAAFEMFHTDTYGIKIFKCLEVPSLVAFISVVTFYVVGGGGCNK